MLFLFVSIYKFLEWADRSPPRAVEKYGSTHGQSGVPLPTLSVPDWECEFSSTGFQCCDTFCGEVEARKITRPTSLYATFG
jgi:hypothetical protein